MKKEKAFAYFVLFCFIAVIVFFFIIFITFMNESRFELKQCANQIGMDFNWKMGSSNVPFSIEYSNKTLIRCCYNNKVLSKDGYLETKCFEVRKE
jgi:hypothetical protein